MAQSLLGIVLGHRRKPSVTSWVLSGSKTDLITVWRETIHRGDDGDVADGNQKPIDLYRELILTFSGPQQWVLAACCRTGMFY